MFSVARSIAPRAVVDPCGRMGEAGSVLHAVVSHKSSVKHCKSANSFVERSRATESESETQTVLIVSLSSFDELCIEAITAV